MRERCWLNNGGTSGKLDTKSARCRMKEQGSLCGSYTVDRVLILKKPMKGIRAFVSVRRKVFGQIVAIALLGGVLNSSLPVTHNHGHRDQQDPQPQPPLPGLQAPPLPP